MRISRKTRDRRGGHMSSSLFGGAGICYNTLVGRALLKKQTVKRKRVLGTKELRQWLLETQYEQAENDADDQSEANDRYFDWLDDNDKEWDDPMDSRFDELDPYDPRDALDYNPNWDLDEPW